MVVKSNGFHSSPKITIVMLYQQITDRTKSTQKSSRKLFYEYIPLSACVLRCGRSSTAAAAYTEKYKMARLRVFACVHECVRVCVCEYEQYAAVHWFRRNRRRFFSRLSLARAKVLKVSSALRAALRHMCTCVCVRNSVVSVAGDDVSNWYM